MSGNPVRAAATPPPLFAVSSSFVAGKLLAHHCHALGIQAVVAPPSGVLQESPIGAGVAHHKVAHIAQHLVEVGP